MTPNSLFPAFVKIDYHSVWGVHSMVIPTREWSPGAPEDDNGVFTDWLDASRSAVDMITDLVTAFAPFFLATTSFDIFTIYTLASAGAKPLPVSTGELGIDGTSVSTSWDKAVQKTLSFRSEDFGILKLVFLDCPSGNNFDRVNSFDADAASLAILDLLKDNDNGWSARDNSRPNAIIQQATTLNEALRKTYRMN
jgi:hypothetical protein